MCMRVWDILLLRLHNCLWFIYASIRFLCGSPSPPTLGLLRWASLAPDSFRFATPARTIRDSRLDDIHSGQRSPRRPVCRGWTPGRAPNHTLDGRKTRIQHWAGRNGWFCEPASRNTFLNSWNAEKKPKYCHWRDDMIFLRLEKRITPRKTYHIVEWFFFPKRR